MMWEGLKIECTVKKLIISKASGQNFANLSWLKYVCDYSHSILL